MTPYTNRIRTLICLLILVTVSVVNAADADSIRLLLKGKLSAGQRIQLMVELSENILKRDQQNSLAIAESAYVLSRSLPLSDTTINAEMLYGFTVFLQSVGDSASYYYNRAEKDLGKTDYPFLRAKLYNFQGLVSWREGRYQDAADKYFKALNVAKSSGNAREHARALNYIGFVYLRRGDYAKAFQYLSEGLKIKLSVGDKEEIAIGYNNLAYFSNAVGNADEAIQYSGKAIAIAEQTSDYYSLGRAYGNLSSSYIRQKDLTKATEYALKALEIKEQYNDFPGIGYALNDLGEIMFQSKKYQEALNYFSEALQRRKELHDYFAMASSYLSLGRTYIKLNKFDDALRSHKAAMELITKNNFRQIEASAHLLLSSIYKAKNNPSQALAAYEQYVAVRDSLLGVNIREQLSDLKLMYQTEQMANEIDLLSRTGAIKSTILKRQQYLIYLLIIGSVIILVLTIIAYERYKREKIITAQLKELNKGKDKLFSILAHDLRSPFTALLGRHEILISDYNILRDEEKMLFLKQSRAQLRKLFDMLENLLDWRMLEERALVPNKERLKLSDSSKAVLEFLGVLADMKQIQILDTIEDDVFVAADKRMLQSVFQNLVSNAIKFTPEKGMITLSSTAEEGFVRISVTDTGRGIKQEDIDALLNPGIAQSETGTSGEAGYGLGLQIVKELIQLNGGKLFISSEPNKGSVFSFTLSLAE